MKALTILLAIALVIASYINWNQKGQINDLYEINFDLVELIRSVKEYQDSALIVTVDQLQTYVINRIDEIPEIDLIGLEKQVKINHSLAFENAEDVFRLHRWHWEGQE